MRAERVAEEVEAFLSGILQRGLGLRRAGSGSVRERLADKAPAGAGAIAVIRGIAMEITFRSIRMHLRFIAAAVTTLATALTTYSDYAPATRGFAKDQAKTKREVEQRGAAENGN
jgi:hypothetical protein